MNEDTNTERRTAPRYEYNRVEISYRSTGDGFLGSGKREPDIEVLANKLAQDGWRLHTVTYDGDGCWQEALFEREVRR